MANLKSSKKDLRRIAKRKVRNRAVKSALKTYVKKVRTADSPEAITYAITKLQSSMDKAVQNGVIHPNQAARRKSRAAKAMNAKVGATEATAKAEKPAKAPKTAKAAPEAKPKPTKAKKGE